MKRSELIKIIKEEIGKVLKEEDLDNYSATLAARQEALKTLNKKLNDPITASPTSSFDDALDLIVKYSKDEAFSEMIDLYQVLANYINDPAITVRAAASEFKRQIEPRWKAYQKKKPENITNLDLVRKQQRKKKIATTP